MHPFTQYVNPHLGRLLGQIGMDKQFVRGEGCWLWDADGERYLDFIAAYGSLPFGFNPPEIWAALTAVRDAGEPSFVQPSALEAAGLLAERLNALAPPGLRYVTFANSGAEAVEAALKMCRAATGRLGVLATDNSFHGKTLGALSATGRESYQKAFGAPVAGFRRIPFGDVGALAAELAERGSEYACFIVEPIQGEGGIIEPPPGYLAAARDLCHAHGALLVLDEIQTGLGRTGRLFACAEEGVTPDVMTLAKALGGGLMPIGAALCTAAVYTEEFAMKHSSTFAGNTLACRAGLAALDLLTRDEGALIRQVAANGEFLRQGLLDLQRRYPNVIRAVRGRGYMLGIDFGISRETHWPSFLAVMAEQDNLTPVISSYLLNVERLRVAPTLNGASTIRIEPPLVATREQCQFALGALERAVAVLARADTGEIARHLLGVREVRVNGAAPAVHEPRPAPSNDPAEGRFAFLLHPVTVTNYPEFDPSLGIFTVPELEDLNRRMSEVVGPFRIGEARIVSKTGATAYGEFITLTQSADELLAMPHREALARVREACDMARDRGARIVGLGAYTAVVTHAGLHLRDPGVPLTTGNSYTVVAAVEAVYAALDRLGTSLPGATAAVVGATGSIGRGVAILLGEGVARLLLVGNPGRPEQSRRRLLKVAADICRHLVHQPFPYAAHSIGAVLRAAGGWPAADAPEAEYIRRFEALERTGGAPVAITVDIDLALPQADVVITATSSTANLVTPQNLKFGATVCDLSRPPNVSREVKGARPDVLVIDGGVIAVPGLPYLGWNFGFERGLAYACMAETMMLGLEHHYQDTSLGADLNLQTILFTRELAEKHGFRLAQLRSFDRPLGEAEWERLVRARTAVLGYPAG